MSCCGGSCGCGSACKCGSGCNGCGEKITTSATIVVEVATKKTYYDTDSYGTEGGSGCNCGTNCSCDTCGCHK